MSSSYLPYHPEDVQLLPPSLQEWLPSNHLSHFISDTVDSLDLSSFHARYDLTRRGNQPYHPAMMVKVLLYAYCTGSFSSRRIARSLHEDVAFRSLAAGNYPMHRTISDFRQTHLESLENIFVQVVHIARECKMVTLGSVAIDATKVKANASRHKAMSYGRMLEMENALKGQIASLLERAQAVDLSESEQDFASTSIPAELAHRQERLKRIQAAKDRLESRQQEADKAKGRAPDDERKPRGKDGRPKGGSPYTRDFGIPDSKAQESFTDPDSRIMQHRGGSFEQSYSCQAAVDRDSRLIVAVSTGNSYSDSAQLVPMAQTVEKMCGKRPEMILADAGYRSELGFKELEEKGFAAIVALGRESRMTDSVKEDKLPYTGRMREKIRTSEGAQAYRQRKWIVEPIFGWIKNVLGFRQMSMRGMTKARAEWSFLCAAVNIKRMHALKAA
jgi:transposase